MLASTADWIVDDVHADAWALCATACRLRCIRARTRPTTPEMTCWSEGNAHGTTRACADLVPSRREATASGSAGARCRRRRRTHSSNLITRHLHLIGADAIAHVFVSARVASVRSRSLRAHRTTPRSRSSRRTQTPAGRATARCCGTAGNVTCTCSREGARARGF